ncbi:MAG: hypothetical protein IT489_00275 [Gammaproteobacteria bacterium]|nr:hypothetical protein [Gammaproteobacteria bacterium]
MKITNHGLLSVFLLFWLSEANARYGVHTGKVALVHSPNWVVIIIFSVGAVFMLFFLRMVFEDYRNVIDSKEKRNGYFLKALGVFGFVGCLYLVFNAAFG